MERRLLAEVTTNAAVGRAGPIDHQDVAVVNGIANEAPAENARARSIVNIVTEGQELLRVDGPKVDGPKVDEPKVYAPRAEERNGSRAGQIEIKQPLRVNPWGPLPAVGEMRVRVERPDTETKDKDPEEGKNGETTGEDVGGHDKRNDGREERTVAGSGEARKEPALYRANARRDRDDRAGQGFLFFMFEYERDLDEEKRQHQKAGPGRNS